MNPVTPHMNPHSENDIQPPVSDGREPLNYHSSLGGSENNQPQSVSSHTADGQARLSNSPTSGNVGSSGQNTLQNDQERNGQNTSEAGGEKQGKPNVQPFEHGFWDPSLKQLRAIYFKPVIMTTVLMMIIVWGFLSIYWGSLWKEQDLSPNLQVMVVNYDSGDIGQSIVQALNQSNYGARPHPTYVFLEPRDYPDETAIMNAIEPNELYWGAVHIMQDATNRLTTARANGDASWNPSAVVTITTATARNYAVVPSIVLSPTQSTLLRAIGSLNARLTGDFVSASANNQGVLTAAARAPQTLGNPVSLTVREIRPWDVPVAIAPTFVGLIYLVILTFQITMASFGARQPIQKFLTLRSIIAMRILTPVLSYIPISLMYTLLNIPFKLPYGATFPYGGGVMVWWCVSYTGMLVLGLAMESMITIVGVKFIGIFMVFFIVSNVSVANFPPALSPSFYKYGYAMPFYNLRQIYLTILFNVGKRVVGPMVHPVSSLEHLNTSCANVWRVVSGATNNSVPPTLLPQTVDVRDVAKAQVNAMSIDEAKGKRFVLCGYYIDLQLVVDYLREQFPEHCDTIPVGNPGVRNQPGPIAKLDVSQAEKILNMTWTPWKQTYSDLVSQLWRMNGCSC